MLAALNKHLMFLQYNTTSFLGMISGFLRDIGHS